MATPPIYLGEAVRITAKVTDADTGLPLDPAPTATVSFYAPGRNARSDHTVRASPDDGPHAMTYRAEAGDFVFYAATDAAPWVAGRWAYMVTVTSEQAVNFEFGTLTLKP